MILDEGNAVRVIFRASQLSLPFRRFVAEESDKGRLLSLEQLLIIQYLLRQPEITTTTAARITQLTESDARETLSQMETDLGYLERGEPAKVRIGCSGTISTAVFRPRGTLSGIGASSGRRPKPGC